MIVEIERTIRSHSESMSDRGAPSILKRNAGNDRVGKVIAKRCKIFRYRTEHDRMARPADKFGAAVTDISDTNTEMVLHLKSKTYGGVPRRSSTWSERQININCEDIFPSRRSDLAPRCYREKIHGNK